MERVKAMEEAQNKGRLSRADFLKALRKIRSEYEKHWKESQAKLDPDQSADQASFRAYAAKHLGPTAAKVR